MIDPETLPDEKVIVLRKAVEFADQTWAELRLREPTGADRKKIAGFRGAEATCFLIFLVSGTPIGAIDKIGARDLKKAEDYLAAFSPAGAPRKVDPESLPESLTVPLRRPVGDGDRTWSELQLREPTAGEMKKIAGLSGWFITTAIIAAVSGVPESVVEKIGERDLNKAEDYLSDFLSDAPATGARA